MTAQQPTGPEQQNATTIEEQLAVIARAEELLDRLLDEAIRNQQQLRETNDQMARIDEKMDRTFAYVKSIDGRVSQLENWKLQVEKNGAHERGIAAGRGNVITRAHLAIVAVAGGSLVLAAQVVFKVIA